MSAPDSVSIMPLVEENRKLHDEVRALKAALADQNVRLDEALTYAQKAGVSYVDVEVDHVRVLNDAEFRSELARDLAIKLLSHTKRMATRIEPGANGTLRYRFAFLRMGK